MNEEKHCYALGLHGDHLWSATWLVPQKSTLVNIVSTLSTGLADDFEKKIMEALTTPAQKRDAHGYIMEHHAWEAVKQNLQEAVAKAVK